MENLWNRAKSLAEDAAKKTQSVTRSTNFTELVAETAKKSKDLAAEASKRADQIKIAALKQADQIQLKSISDYIPPQLSSLSDYIPPQLSSLSISDPSATSDAELEKFGITDDLRSFIKGLTATTFHSFEVRDEPEASDVVTVSNVRQDLTKWQAMHATLVLSAVKEISRLRYELCPRVMKERRFWRIYFTLVSTHVAPYEKQYMEELKLKAKQVEDDKVKQSPTAGETDKPELIDENVKSRPLTSTSSSAEQDLDSFLLGDLEDDDGGPVTDDGEGSFDDDFDKIDNSDVEDAKQSKVKAATS